MKTAPTETTDAQTSLADVAWNKRQTLATYEQTFVVAAIPVTVEAGITGGLGMDLDNVWLCESELTDDDTGHVYLVSATWLYHHGQISRPMLRLQWGYRG